MESAFLFIVSPWFKKNLIKKTSIHPFKYNSFQFDPYKLLLGLYKDNGIDDISKNEIIRNRIERSLLKELKEDGFNVRDVRITTEESCSPHKFEYDIVTIIEIFRS